MTTATTRFQRGSLANCIEELKRQKETKIDFVADVRQLDIVAEQDSNALRIVPAKDATAVREFFTTPNGSPIREQALIQIGERVTPKIPPGFLRELAQRNSTAAASLTTSLMHDGGDDKRMLFRFLDGSLRAALSNKYRIMDNYDFAFTALDAIKQNDGAVIDCFLSDQRFHLTFTSPRLSTPALDKKNGGPNTKMRGTLPNGMEIGKVYPYTRVSNSETGHGGLYVQVGLLEPRCINGMITDNIASKVHLGERLVSGVITEETQSAMAKALMLQCRDHITASLTPVYFERLILKYRAAATDAIENPSALVNGLIIEGMVPQMLKDQLLKHFLGDYDHTRLGAAQAVSRLSQDVPDAEMACDLESLAGVLMSNPTKAKELALAGV